MAIPKEIEENLKNTLKNLGKMNEKMMEQIAQIPNLTPTHRKPLKKSNGSASITKANAVIIEFNTLQEAEKFFKALDKWA